MIKELFHPDEQITFPDHVLESLDVPVTEEDIISEHIFDDDLYD